MQLQYLRGILLINNLVASVIDFATSNYWSRHQLFFYVFGSVLLVSWLMSIIAIAHTLLKDKKTPKTGYFQLPLTTVQKRAKSNLPKAASLIVVDLGFGIAFIILSAIGYPISWSQARTMACTGGIVAATVHLFFALVGVHDRLLGRYRLKLVWVDLNEEEDNDDNSDGSSASKEQSFSGQTSAQLPEQLTGSPHRGSPSTRPTHGTTLQANEPIKLIEPTETDVLVGDHD